MGLYDGTLSLEANFNLVCAWTENTVKPFLDSFELSNCLSEFSHKALLFTCAIAKYIQWYIHACNSTRILKN